MPVHISVKETLIFVKTAWRRKETSVVRGQASEIGTPKIIFVGHWHSPKQTAFNTTRMTKQSNKPVRFGSPPFESIFVGPAKLGTSGKGRKNYGRWILERHPRDTFVSLSPHQQCLFRENVKMKFRLNVWTILRSRMIFKTTFWLTTKY